jgi:glycine oxidase
MLSKTTCQKPDVVIIGGGVIGCGIAYFLASDYGMRPLIIERDAVASGASGGAAGELGAVGRHHYGRSFTSFLLRGIELHSSMAPILIAESGIDYLLSDIPLLRPAFNESEASKLQEQMIWQRDLGIEVEWLDSCQVHSMGTWLSEEATGAAFTVEKQLEAYLFAIALAQAAEHHGAEIKSAEVTELIQEGSRVIGVSLSNGDRIETGAVIVANGPWSSQLLDSVGFQVPVIPLRGQIVHVSPPSNAKRPTHAIFHETGYMLPKAGGDLLLGTTQEKAGFDRNPTIQAQHQILEAVMQLAPMIIDSPINDLTACLRPYCTDEMPVLGQVPESESLYIATGHGYKGVTLALITGKCMAALLAEGHSDADFRAFSPSRFSHIQ